MKKITGIVSLLILMNGFLIRASAQQEIPDTLEFNHFFETLPHSFHRNYFEFTRDSIPRKFCFQTDSGSVTREFDPLGRITNEILELKNGYRMIRYFDKHGVCFKYRKMEEDTCHYLFTDREPYQYLFDSSQKVLERVLIKKFGAEIYTRHFRLEEPRWSTEEPYDYGGLMRQPFKKPYEISLSGYFLIDDSTEIYLGTFELDSNLIPVEGGYENPMNMVNSPGSDILKKTNFTTLMHLFDKKGYRFGGIDWDDDKKTFMAYYSTDLYPYLDGKDTLWEGKTIHYDLNTKKYITDRYTPPFSIACGYYSPFKREFTDTFSVAPGWRTEMLPEAIISIPPGWNMHTYEYSYHHKITYITNGEDTLVYELAYGRVMEWENEMRNDPVYSELEKRFPNGERLGREVDFYLRPSGSKCYTLSLYTVEEGVGMDFSEITNIFRFNHLCPGHIGLALDILNSIRFFRY